MKMKTIIIYGISSTTVAIILLFFLMIYQPGAGMYVRADIIINPPEKYVEISLLELDKYPHVKEAVNNPGEDIKLPFDHTESITNFGKILMDNDTQNIKVGDEYYKIDRYSAD